MPRVLRLTLPSRSQPGFHSSRDSLPTGMGALMSVRIDEAELRRYVSLDYTVQLAGALQGPQIAAFESLLEDLWNVYLAIDDSECRASIWITHTSSLGQVDSTPLAARSDLRYHLSQDVGLVILDTGAWHVVD